MKVPAKVERNVNFILLHKCYCCGKPITQANNAIEHIIPNALGGKLKSRTILCSGCNGQLNKEVDAPFCEQMKFVVNRLNIKREKGNPPAIKARLVQSGNPIHIESDGTTFAPRTTIKKVGRGYTIECDQGNIRNAKETLKRKLPNVRFSEGKPFVSDVEFRLECDFGGPSCYRAITKLAVNYFLHRGGSIDQVTEAISFVKSGGNNTFCVLYYPMQDVLPRRSANELTHVIAFRGDRSQGLLYAYVELFSAFRFLVCLAHDFNGHRVNDSYCFDLRQRKEVQTEVQFDECRASIAKIVESPAPHLDAFKLNLRRLFSEDLTIDFSSW